MAGNAIRGAAAEALEKWKNEERPARAVHQYRPPRTTPLDPQTGKSEPNFAYGYVAEVVEIEVDCETGQIKLNNIICADDVGRAINPQQVQGQIEGAIVQAAGYAALENFVQADGKVLTKTFSSDCASPPLINILYFRSKRLRRILLLTTLIRRMMVRISKIMITIPESIPMLSKIPLILPPI